MKIFAIGQGILKDNFKFLRLLLKNVFEYIPQLVRFLALGEVALLSPTDQFLGGLLEGEGLSDYLQPFSAPNRQLFGAAGVAPAGSSSLNIPDLLRYQHTLKQSFIALEPLSATDRNPVFANSGITVGDSIVRNYTPVFIDRECDIGRRFLRKLNQLSFSQMVWIDQVSTEKSPAKKTKKLDPVKPPRTTTKSLLDRLSDAMMTFSHPDTLVLKQKLLEEIHSQSNLCDELLAVFETLIFKVFYQLNQCTCIFFHTHTPI